VAFLRALRRSIRIKLVLILDRWGVHRSKVLRNYLDRHAATIHVEWLPPYAPDLNPTEQVWNHAKYTDLANFIPRDCDDLSAHVDESIAGQRTQTELLRSFFHLAGLNLR
jgi:transposase